MWFKLDARYNFILLLKLATFVSSILILGISAIILQTACCYANDNMKDSCIACAQTQAKVQKVLNIKKVEDHGKVLTLKNDMTKVFFIPE